MLFFTCAVLTAHNGQVAKQLLAEQGDAEHKIDLILTDVVMPEVRDAPFCGRPAAGIGQLIGGDSLAWGSPCRYASLVVRLMRRGSRFLCTYL